MRIDTQAHFLPDPYRAALAAEAERDDSFARVVAGLLAPGQEAPVRHVGERRVADLDATGIDVQVLSVVPPGAAFGPAEAAGANARAVNDALVAAASRFPGRFLVLATLPLPHVSESLTELERVLADPLVRGVSVPALGAGWTPDDARFEPVYAALAERGAPLVLHPALEDWPRAYADWGLGTSVAMMAGSTVGALRLLLSGMLDRVPKLDVLVTHLGGAVPFLMQRIDNTGRGDAAHDVRHYWRERIWVDSFSNHPPALRCTIDTVGAGRVVLGSDYPDRARLESAVRDVEGLGLPDDDRDSILGGTALRWFAP